MKARMLLLLIPFAACSETQPIPPPPPPPPVVSTPPHPVRPVKKTVAQVVAQFERVAQKELRAVTAPHVTVEFIHDLKAADLDARKAVGALVHQKLKPSAVALANAQAAVAKVSELLASIAEEKP